MEVEEYPFDLKRAEAFCAMTSFFVAFLPGLIFALPSFYKTNTY
jgi:hypothetical protein